MKKLLAGLLGLFGISNAFANPACMVCTLAVVGTIGAAKEIGVPEMVVAVWIGALLVILGYWTIKWFDKKNWHFFGRDVILILLSFSMIAGVYISEIDYKPCYWIFDAFLFWAIVGGITYIVSQTLYEFMKKRNNNHAHFPFEKVVIALLMLAMVSTIVFLTNCN